MTFGVFYLEGEEGGGAVHHSLCVFRRIPTTHSDQSRPPRNALAHADGRYPKLMAGFAKTDVLVLDSCAVSTIGA